MFGATVNIWWTVGNGAYFYCANANKIGAGRPVERHSRIVPPSDKPSNCAPRYVPSLERLQARYMVDTELFPFLKLLLPPHDDAESDGWEFLHTNFGVGRHDDLDFYLTILSSILDANESAETVMNSARVYGVYGRIQANLVPEDQSRQERKIRYVRSRRDNRNAFSDAKVFQGIIRSEIRRSGPFVAKVEGQIV